MKMRLMGTLEELQDLRQVLQQVEALKLLEMSAPYPNRGDSQLYRVYAEICVK